MNAPASVLHVLDGRAEGVGGEASGFGEDLLAAFVDGAAPDRHRSGVERPLAEFDPGGVPFDDVDVVRPQAERVGGDLRVARRVPLAVIGGADVDADPAGGMDQDARVLPATKGKPACGVRPAGAQSGEFGVGGQPDASLAAAAAELRLFPTQLVVSDDVQGGVEIVLVVAAVQDERPVGIG